MVIRRRTKKAKGRWSRVAAVEGAPVSTRKRRRRIRRAAIRVAAGRRAADRGRGAARGRARSRVRRGRDAAAPSPSRDVAAPSRAAPAARSAGRRRREGRGRTAGGVDPVTGDLSIRRPIDPSKLKSTDPTVDDGGPAISRSGG